MASFHKYTNQQANTEACYDNSRQSTMNTHVPDAKNSMMQIARSRRTDDQRVHKRVLARWIEDDPSVIGHCIDENRNQWYRVNHETFSTICSPSVMKHQDVSFDGHPSQNKRGSVVDTEIDETTRRDNEQELRGRQYLSEGILDARVHRSAD